MPLRTEPMEEPQLNLTPLIDIVFNLLMFLMLATRFVAEEDAERQFEIQLATASTAKPLTPVPDAKVVVVKQDGSIFYNGAQVTLANLEIELIAAKKNYSDQAVQVRGEGEGRYQQVVDVLSICNRAQINNIALPVKLKPEAAK